MSRHLGIAALAALLLPAVALSADFAHLRTGDHRIETLHSLPITFTAPATYELAGPDHRLAHYNAVPFEVSFAGFLREDRAIMIYAERVADGSGAANYTTQPPSNWPFDGFRERPLRCIALGEADLEGEYDLLWLRARGLDPVGGFWLEQHLLSTSDFNEEVIVTLIARTESCDERPLAQATIADLKIDLAATRQ